MTTDKNTGTELSTSRDHYTNARTLSRDELLNLLKHNEEAHYQVSSDIRAECEAKLIECEVILAGRLPNNAVVKRPTIKYDLKGHTAGIANSQNNVIRLNADALNDPRYRDDMVNNTLPHEYAHIVVDQIWPEQARYHHGNQWRVVMRTLGFASHEITRCHSYETKAARVHQKFTVHCYGCGKDLKIGSAVKLRMQTGRVNYHCKHCKSPLTYESWRNV